MTALPPPLPDRDCGACTACCVELAIDDPDLHKPDGVPCRHRLPSQGCAIYAARPQTCRAWYCGWRFLHLSEAMRPDRSGILLMPDLAATDKWGEGGKGGLRIVATGDDHAAVLENEELLDLVARCVKGGAPIFLSHGNGAFAKRALMNEVLREAVAAGDRPRFVEILRDTLSELAQQVRLEMAVAKLR